jgi:hypothetical protein
MIKAKREKSGPEKTQATLFAQKAIGQTTDGKVAKTRGYDLRTGKYRRAHEIGESKVPSKKPQPKILYKAFFPAKFAPNFSLPVSFSSPRTAAVDAVKGILKKVGRTGLVPVLVGGVVSFGIIYLVAKGRITKTDAFRHVIKVASGAASSDIVEIGTVAVLAALSSLPVVAQIAVLAGVSIGVKKLRNRS